MQENNVILENHNVNYSDAISINARHKLYATN